MIDLTQVIVALIGLAVSVITVILIPLIRNRIGDEKFATLSSIVSVVVKAAEQLYNEPGRGATKLKYALDMVNAQLQSRNLIFDSNVVRAAIEAEVLKLNAG